MLKSISVIIPVHNTAKYLQKCIESLLNQSFRDFEIILINDGSTDKSTEICIKYRNLYPNIRYIQSSHLGVSAARNIGLYYACGRFVTFVDSDDYVKPFYLENLIKYANSDCVVANYCIVDKGGMNKSNISLISQHMKYDYAIQQLFEPKGYKGYLWNKLFRKDIIDANEIKFNEQINVWEDLLFCFQYFLFCDDIYYSNISDYCYVQNSNSLVHKKECNIEESKFKSISIIYNYTNILNINIPIINQIYVNLLIKRYLHNDKIISINEVLQQIIICGYSLSLKERVMLNVFSKFSILKILYNFYFRKIK